jgi:hypothetical protein
MPRVKHVLALKSYIGFLGAKSSPRTTTNLSSCVHAFQNKRQAERRMARFEGAKGIDDKLSATLND